jgi:NADPH:quinone reductase-like Zn-dependent oxidoreductase
MKAIVCTNYGPPEVLQFKELEKPDPKDNEVCIKVFATTVTVADFRIRSFTIPPSFWIPARLMLGIRRPKKSVLGIELAGEIESIGKGVKRFKKGDRVFAASFKDFGAYAEYKCLAEDSAIALMPVNTTYEEAAAIPVGARTALHYLRKAGLDNPSSTRQKILIYGASGSVGTYAVQLARYFGAEVTAVCSTANLALVKSLGAHKAIDYTAPDFINKLELYDVIFLAVDKCSFSVCNKALNKNGFYLNITAPIKTLRMMWTSITSEKKIMVGENAPESAEDLIFLKNLIEAREIKPIIDRSYPFEQIVEAHRYVGEGHKKGNVSITVVDQE